ncbi:MAG: type II toxin-antitoxin system ParD family antitoxin [Alphaproteobacteria bacterium]|nr:type II toxin-antitoxin system ParD family antitoxin [Alphaproteobacteria bacterium]
MPTRNVVFTDRQARTLESMVASGRYQNASEIIREGLRLVELRDAEDKARLKALREAAQVGLDDLAAERFETFSSRAELRKRFNEIADAAIAEGARRAGRKG